MAGFLLVRKRPGEDGTAVRDRMREAFHAFSRKGLVLKEAIERQGFMVFVYGKIHHESENVVHLVNGDFIVATGTLFFRGAFGSEALRQVHRDFLTRADLFSELRGHFGVIISRGDQLHVFNDYSGSYLLYADDVRSFVTTSFLVASRACSSRSISEQELYEYLSSGGMFGYRTYFRDVCRLDNAYSHQLLPAPIRIRKETRFEGVNPKLPLVTQVRIVHDSLVDYYRMIKTHFGDSVTTALTGGFDTRLSVALMHEAGIRPNLYVYGEPSSVDVRVSSAICEAEHLPLVTYDKSKHPLNLEEFPQIVLDSMHLLDGFPGGDSGVIDNGAELFTRHERIRNHRLQINSSAGEIFRNHLMLPDRPMTASAFLKSTRYDGIADFSVFRKFDKKRYFATLSGKVEDMLGLSGTLPRHKIEELFIVMMCSHWLSPNNYTNNLLSHAVTPFVEACFAIPSYTIPVRYKAMGMFEGRLIQMASPALARHMTMYGFRPAGPFPLRQRLSELVKCYAPVSVRPFLRRNVQQRMYRRHRPAYLSRDFLSVIFGSGPMMIEEYIDVDRVNNSLIFNRALTAELVINDRYWQDLDRLPEPKDFVPVEG